MCICAPQWQAADCSDAVCPYGEAHITTGQGDLNMDGDKNDNSHKRLSELGWIKQNTDVIHFAHALVEGELEEGDGIRICDETYFVVTTAEHGSAGITANRKHVTVDHVAPLDCVPTGLPVTSVNPDGTNAQIIFPSPGYVGLAVGHEFEISGVTGTDAQVGLNQRYVVTVVDSASLSATCVPEGTVGSFALVNNDDITASNPA
jgi:hypothetical protein